MEDVSSLQFASVTFLVGPAPCGTGPGLGLRIGLINYPHSRRGGTEGGRAGLGVDAWVVGV